ncbi:hypothetical protein ACXWR7_12270, partial [Streptococcus pyogenes]
ERLVGICPPSRYPFPVFSLSLFLFFSSFLLLSPPFSPFPFFPCPFPPFPPLLLSFFPPFPSFLPLPPLPSFLLLPFSFLF